MKNKLCIRVEKYDSKIVESKHIFTAIIALAIVSFSGCLGLRFQDRDQSLNITVPDTIKKRFVYPDPGVYAEDPTKIAGLILVTRVGNGGVCAAGGNDMRSFDDSNKVVSTKSFIKPGARVLLKQSKVPLEFSRKSKVSGDIKLSYLTAAMTFQENQVFDISITNSSYFLLDRKSDVLWKEVEAFANKFKTDNSICALWFVEGAYLQTLIYQAYKAVSCSGEAVGGAFGAEGACYIEDGLKQAKNLFVLTVQPILLRYGNDMANTFQTKEVTHMVGLKADRYPCPDPDSITPECLGYRMSVDYEVIFPEDKLNVYFEGRYPIRASSELAKKVMLDAQ
ncbi:MAG: hypothetical protein AB1405_09570 [Bdellovibrionota bacterium]